MSKLDSWPRTRPSLPRAKNVPWLGLRIFNIYLQHTASIQPRTNSNCTRSYNFSSTHPPLQRTRRAPQRRRRRRRWRGGTTRGRAGGGGPRAYGCPPTQSICVTSVWQTLEGSFSAVSKPNFATKAPLESSQRDLQVPHSSREPNFQLFKKNQ